MAVTWACPSARAFETAVPSASRPGTWQTVRWSRAAGWACSCEAWFWKGRCRHVEGLRAARCGWNEDAEAVVRPVDGLCPSCGKPVEKVNDSEQK